MRYERAKVTKEYIAKNSMIFVNFLTKSLLSIREATKMPVSISIIMIRVCLSALGERTQSIKRTQPIIKQTKTKRNLLIVLISSNDKKIIIPQTIKRFVPDKALTE